MDQFLGIDLSQKLQVIQVNRCIRFLLLIRKLVARTSEKVKQELFKPGYTILLSGFPTYQSTRHLLGGDPSYSFRLRFLGISSELYYFGKKPLVPLDYYCPKKLHNQM